MFTDPVLAGIAAQHGKTVAQVILRWDIQRNVAIIPKSVRRERMAENLEKTDKKSRARWGGSGGRRGSLRWI